MKKIKLHEKEWYATRERKNNICILAKDKKTVRKIFDKVTGKTGAFNLDNVKLVFMVEE